MGWTLVDQPVHRFVFKRATIGSSPKDISWIQTDVRYSDVRYSDVTVDISMCSRCDVAYAYDKCPACMEKYHLGLILELLKGSEMGREEAESLLRQKHWTFFL